MFIVSAEGLVEKYVLEEEEVDACGLDKYSEEFITDWLLRQEEND